MKLQTVFTEEKAIPYKRMLCSCFKLLPHLGAVIWAKQSETAICHHLLKIINPILRHICLGLPFLLNK